MGDDFRFIPPPRREARTFEPPPWETEAFEELRRKREAAEAEQAKAAAEQGEVVTVESEDEALGAFLVEGAVMGGDEQGDGPGAEAEPEEGATAGVSDGQVVAMLAQLAAQEPNAKAPITTVALVMAAVCGVFGLVLLVWGVVALANARTSGRVGMIGGSLFFFIGVAAVLFAVWLTVKTLRQRGVL